MTDSTPSVVKFPGSRAISNEDVLVYDCDILIPAALECQITTANARNVKAKLIVEDANGPLTAVADDVLRKKDIVVLPDILANAGGEVVDLYEELSERYDAGFNEGKPPPTLRDAALVKAINRIATVVLQRDIWP